MQEPPPPHTTGYARRFLESRSLRLIWWSSPKDRRITVTVMEAVKLIFLDDEIIGRVERRFNASLDFCC